MLLYTRFLLILLLFLFPWLLKCTQNEEAKRIPYTLQEETQVVVDTWGNRHIYAKTRSDAIFVQCYEAVRDRGFQLDYVFRDVTGRLSEWFGRSYLERDKSRRIIGFERLGKESFQHLKKETPSLAHLIEVCTDGINRAREDAILNRNGMKLPDLYQRIDPTYTPPPVEPHHLVAVGKGIAFQLSFSGDVEFLLYLLYLLLGEKFFEIIHFAPLYETTIVDGEDTGRWVPPSHRPSSLLPDLSLRELPPVSEETLGPAFDLLKKMREWKRGSFFLPLHSNNWIVSGTLTATGFPILANDPHLGFDLPPKFLESHLVYKEGEEEWNLSGINLAGAPGILIGTNGKIAWGLTTTLGDVTDLYRETLTPDGTKVIRNGKKIPLKFIEETICVRKGGGKVKECEPEKFVIRWVPGHGPLLNDLAPGITDLLGYISLRWAGFEPTREIPAILLVNHARNCDELFQGVRHFMVGEQNFVCIDREGNIAYIAPALLPIRPWNWQEYPPYLPLPGDGRFEWQGFYDYSWVPQVKNPKKGFIVTANNDPLGTTLDNNPTNDLFYHGHFYDLGARANRITELLKGYSEWGTKITLDHMALLQWDVKSKVADRFLPYLLSLETLFCSPDPSSELCEGFTLLKNWDRVNRTDSPGPTLFHLFLAHLFVETFSDEIPLFLNIMDLTGSDEIQALGRTLWGILNGTVSSDLWDRKNTPQREGFSDMAFSSLKKAIETGKETFRAEGGYPLPMTLWTWGKAHFVKFSHLAFDDLSFGPVSYHGGKNVVDASDFTLIGENGVRKPPYIQNDGPNMRLLIQFTPTGVEIRNILPGGAWEDPLSPHYTDQLLLWLKGEQKKVPYGKEEVEREKMEEYRYLPGMIRAGSP